MDAAGNVNAEAIFDQYLSERIETQALHTPLPDELARKLVGRLKAEADRHWGIDPHRSLLFAERIVAIGEARQDARQVALGVMARGDALKFLGRTTEAWEALEQAGEIFRRAEDLTGWARTRIGRLYLSTMLNTVPEALSDAARARQILAECGEQELLLRLEFQTAYVHNYVGNPVDALGRYQSALEIASGLGEAGEMYAGPLYTNIGSAYEALGDWRQAMDCYQRARETFARRGESLFLATAEANIAYIAQAQGNYRGAIQMLERALEQASDHSELEVTRIRWHLLECYLGLNRLEEARSLAVEVVAETELMKDDFELGRALVSLATSEAGLASIERAEAALDRAEAIFTAEGAAPLVGSVRLRRGKIALLQGDPGLALRLAGEAAAAFASAGQRINTADASLLEGQALLAIGDLPGSRQAGSRALLTAIHENLPALRYTAHVLLGRCCESQKVLKCAGRHYQAAMLTVEHVQRGLTITLQPGFLEDKGEASRALIGLQLRQGCTESALETLERAKSQVLLGYLANRERLRWARDDPASQALVEELDRLRAEHHRFYNQAHPAAGTPATGTPATDATTDHAQALAEARGRERRMRAITEKLYLLSAGDRAASPTEAPSCGEIQRSLEAGSLLIEYYNDGNRLHAFLLDGASIEVHALPLEVSALDRLLVQLEVNLAAALQMGAEAPSIHSLSHLAVRILQRLSAGLLEPLDLQRFGAARLVIVPYGGLHSLPFHLLHDGSAYLFERYEVSILPAAGLALQSSPRRAPGAVILANSWGGRLPFTRQEAEIVKQLCGGEVYLEEAARRTVFERPPAQVLHIAAHGRHRLDQPDLSYIELDDGQLYTDDLLQQDMSYELVTLSACETGRARIAPGDEPIGLGRGFLYAGAGALVLSLWPVPDETTLRLMEAMYRALQNGASKAAALNLARRAVLARAGDLHPAFWGAFQLVGNPGPLSSPGHLI